MMQARMRAARIERPGPDGIMSLCDTNIPEPASHEVLIRVAYAGVNRADLLQKANKYPLPDGTVPIPGLEVSGEIVKLGSGITGWSVGDRVCALLEQGGYAEYCVAPADQMLKLPDFLDYRQAAALPEALYTVWLSVYQEGKLQPGETLLVHAGASGIGTMAIQIAQMLGAQVLATAGSEAKCRLCEELGAQHAINYKQADFLEVWGKESADVVLDPTGGDNLQKNLSILRRNGRLVSIGFLRGAKAEINAGHILVKHLHWSGSTLRSRSTVEKSKLTEEIQQHIWPLVEEGRLLPVLDREFVLEDVEKAHSHMEQNLNLGKIVLHIEAS